MINSRLLTRSVQWFALTAVSVAGVAGCGSTRRMPANARANPAANRPAATGPAFAVSTTPGRLVGVPGPAQSDFEITFDRQAMTDAGVSVEAASQAVDRFFATYPFFALSDLQEAKVRRENGETIPLRKIATIDVWFGVARTEIVDQTRPGPK